MECAGRGLSFYSYQSTQEIVYQEYLERNLRANNAKLSDELDDTIHKANSKVTELIDKLGAMDTLYKQLEEKNRAAEQQFREKLKKHAQLQKLYDKLKNKTMAENLEGAAEMDADNALHNHPHGRTGSGHSGVRRNTYNTWNNPQPSSRNGTFLVPPAPTHNRQRFATHHNSGNSMMGSMRGINPLESDYSRQGTPFRQPLGNLNPNVQGSGGNGFGQGMSAGLKMGRQQSGPYARSGGQAPMQKCSGELGAR